MDQRYRFVMGVLAALLAAAPAGDALAKSKKAAAAPSAPKVLNACGCYSNASGACFCGKRGKCECPGECEPKGCEEKRARQMQKEMATEVKKAAEADKKERQSEKDRLLRPEPEAKPKAGDKGDEAGKK
jgi:hypothetical protein